MAISELGTSQLTFSRTLGTINGDREITFSVRQSFWFAYRRLKNQHDAEDVTQTALASWLSAEGVPSPELVIKRTIGDLIKSRQGTNRTILTYAKMGNRCTGVTFDDVESLPADYVDELRTRLCDSANATVQTVLNHGGNMTNAATELGISRVTLYAYLRRIAHDERQENGEW